MAPETLLLDEATASLDAENETQIQAAPSRLLVDKTVLVIAHRMHKVTNANQIVILDAGSVTERGTPQKLLAHDGLFTHMVSLQRRSGSWTLH